MKKHHLYLDNSCLKSIQYNLSYHSIQTLKKAIKLNQIQVLSSSILEREISDHCGSMVQSEIEKYGKDSVLDTFLKSDIDQLREKIKDLSAKDFLSHFNSNLSPKNIDCDVDWRIVFDKYFKKEPPFSTKKREEFPDAFVIEMLKPYLKKNLHIISGDNDFFEWAKIQKNVVAYRSVKDFSDYFIKEQKSHLVGLYSKNLQIIDEAIQEHIEETYSNTDEFETDSYHSEIDSSTVNDLQTIHKSILSEDLEKNNLEIEFHTSGEVDLEIVSSVVHYDSIDKDETFMGSNRNSKTLNARFEGKLTIYFENDGEIEATIFHDENVFPSQIEIPGEWESFLDGQDYDD